jgi:tRNA/rRNA methyltransferase
MNKINKVKVNKIKIDKIKMDKINKVKVNNIKIDKIMIDIILIEPEHEGNVGAIARSMANFGFKNLIIINPKCDLNNDEFFKRAKHAQSKGDINIKIKKRIPKYDLLIGTTAKINTDYNLNRSPILSEKLAEKILPYSTKQKIALVFGRESIGLTNKEINKCDFICTINSSKQYSTLNLSHATTIMLYELHKSMNKEKIVNIKLAENNEKKQIQKMINEIIKKCEIKHKVNIQNKLWRNIFSKAILTKREAYGIMGLLNKIKNKL